MSSEGEASAATVFEYHEGDGIVWARSEGGSFALVSWSGRERATTLRFGTAK